MIEADTKFNVSPNALFESFDNEIIIINMQSGTYYSLDATALGIWNLAQARHTVQTIIEATQNSYTGDADAISEAVMGLLEELEGQGLLVRAEAEAIAAPSDASPVKDSGLDSCPMFQAPVVSKFTDMEDLLLLDPIHEVDDTGWPRAKPATDDGALQAGGPVGTNRGASG